MGVHVLKFGGTSVGSLKRIEHVSEIVMKRAKEHSVVVVVSAMSGETDQLIAMAQSMHREPVLRELDCLLTTGEQKTTALLALCLLSKGQKAQSMLGFQVPIYTSDDFSTARIESIDVRRIQSQLDLGHVIVVPGFQGVTHGGDLTTLGRGGSDTTAVAIAAALKANVCDIYTDVEGVFTTDPNVCADAKKLAFISYDEMLEMASLGAKVLQTRSVEFAKKFNVPVHVRSTFKEVDGTMVIEEPPMMESLVVAGITATKNEAKVVVEGLADRLGVAADLFTMLGDAQISVDVIVQTGSQAGTTDISFTVPKADLKQALSMIENNKALLGYQRVTGHDGISKVSAVGNGMRSHSGVAAKMFRALADAKISIQMISTSEIKISCVIDQKDSDRAVQAIHAAFALDQLPSPEK